MDAPRLTASMHIALADLALDRLTVVYPGDRPYPLADRVTVVPLAASRPARRRLIQRACADALPLTLSRTHRRRADL